MAMMVIAALGLVGLLIFDLLPDTPTKRHFRNDGPIFGPWVYWEKQIRKAGVSRTQAEPTVSLPEYEETSKSDLLPGPASNWVRDENHPTWRLWDIDENVGLVSQQEREHKSQPAYYWAVFHPDFERRVLGQPIRGWAKTLEAAKLLVELNWNELRLDW